MPTRTRITRLLPPTLLLAAAISFGGCQSPERNHTLDAHMYLSNFLPHNELIFDGEVVAEKTPEGTFVGEPLRMQVQSWRNEEVRVAFQVGDDRSRTWVLTRQEDGRVHLRHDHRDPDGTPHDLTDYGGYGYVLEDWTSCSFAADERTTRMLPEAATNVWTMSFDRENDRFIYDLRRHDRPRFRAVFDLTTGRLPGMSEDD